jgi:hypothetical protein
MNISLSSAVMEQHAAAMWTALATLKRLRDLKICVLDEDEVEDEPDVIPEPHLPYFFQSLSLMTQVK